MYCNKTKLNCFTVVTDGFILFSFIAHMCERPDKTTATLSSDIITCYVAENLDTSECNRIFSFPLRDLPSNTTTNQTTW